LRLRRAAPVIDPRRVWHVRIIRMASAERGSGIPDRPASGATVDAAPPRGAGFDRTGRRRAPGRNNTKERGAMRTKWLVPAVATWCALGGGMAAAQSEPISSYP